MHGDFMWQKAQGSPAVGSVMSPLSVPQVARLLGNAGLLPFILGAMFAIVWDDWATLVATGLGYYTLAIVSFLAGAWWGIALLKREPVMLFTSNAVVVAAWAATLILDSKWALAALCILLILTVIVENRHPMFAPQPNYYRRMRLRLTGVATLSLIVVIAVA